MSGTFSVVKMAWAWLGQRSKTMTVDVAPANYELDTTAVTSEKYLVVLRATYTVGPRIIVDGAGNKKNQPLLHAKKLVASPPDHVSNSNKGGLCPRHVRKLLERHVSVLAAGMTTEQMFMKGSSGFVDEVLGRVNLDLAKPKSGGGHGLFYVHRARVQRFAVHVPSDKLSVAVVTKEGATAPKMTPFFAMQLGARAQGVKLDISVHAGEVAVAMAMVNRALQKVESEKQIKVPGVTAELHMELDGKTTLRLKLKAKKSNKADAVRAFDSTTMIVVAVVPDERMRMDKNRSRDATKSVPKSLKSRKARIYDCKTDLQDDAAGAGVHGRASH